MQTNVRIKFLKNQIILQLFTFYKCFMRNYTSTIVCIKIHLFWILKNEKRYPHSSDNYFPEGGGEIEASVLIEERGKKNPFISSGRLLFPVRNS